MALTATYRPGIGQERRHAAADRRDEAVHSHGQSGAAIRDAGIAATYAALAIIFLWIGAMKFTAYEAQGIAPFVMNSPLLSWMHGAFGIQRASMVIGVIELTIGVLLLARWFSPRLSAAGAAMSIVTYLITLSFMLSTPGVTAQEAGGFPALSAEIGQFLAKDMVLLAASVVLLGDALLRSRRREHAHSPTAAG